MQPYIVGIRLSPVGKIYHFDASDFLDIKIGDHVIVSTARGAHVGEVVTLVNEPPPPHDENGWKAIDRLATPRDLLLQQTWNAKQTEAMINSREKASQLNLHVKIIAAEFSYDGSRLAIMFSTEDEEKIDLKVLRKEIQKKYPQSQVEMRQIGPRDVAKILGGMGACGLETRCCTKFLTDFSPISIKMAKEQGISLTPSEITGICGRLRCCLLYEYELYVEARKTLPKRKKKVVTPKGAGKVIDIYPLRDSVLVELEEDRKREEFYREDLQPWDELEALRRKAQEPCGHGENCSCGKKNKNSDHP